MNSMRFRLRANGKEMPLIIPADQVESAILPSAEHEAGHITAAHHLHAEVLGIAVGIVPNGTQGRWILQALYKWKDSTIRDKCVVKTAGPAADLLFHGAFDKKGAAQDLEDIRILTGEASFEPYLDSATEIISLRKNECTCVAEALKAEVTLDIERVIEIMPGKHVSTLLLCKAQLLKCLPPL